MVSVKEIVIMITSAKAILLAERITVLTSQVQEQIVASKHENDDIQQKTQ